jgi:hypothetical protein
MERRGGCRPNQVHLSFGKAHDRNGTANRLYGAPGAGDS